MKKLRIAIWHNLPSGGGKRQLYNHVKGLLDRGHYIESWCPDTADTDYLPLGKVIKENVVPLQKKRSLYHSPVRPIGITRELLDTLETHCSVCAEEILRGKFDVLFANACMFLRTTPIAKYLNLPSALYLGEPYRWFYEAMPELPWIAPLPFFQQKPSFGSIRDYFVRQVSLTGIRLQARAELEYAKRFDRILVNSVYSRESVQRAYNLNSKVCYLGIDTDYYQPTGEPKENFVVGLGTLYHGKGVDRAIRALGTVAREKRPDLVWIGNGALPEALNEYKALAASLQVNFIPRIHIPDPEVISLLSRALAMVYTSRLEPFGLAPLEANACMTPVVGVAEGGIRETIRDGVNGFLVADDNPQGLGERICRFLDNPQLAAEMGAKARDYVKETWNLQQCTDNIERHLTLSACREAPGPFPAGREPEIRKIRRSSPRWFTAPVRAVGRLPDGRYWLRTLPAYLARVIYHRLPISAGQKERMKFWLYGHFGLLFRRTESYRLWLGYRPDSRPEGQLPDLGASFRNTVSQLAHGPFAFSDDPLPLVSVIVPVYNEVNLSLQCLASLAQVTSRYSFEIIVIDDGSRDATREKLEKIPGIRYLRNGQNMGFIRSCNRAAADARGEFLVFLNNDTVIQDGWLDHLVDTFQIEPQTGLVGSKLIYPNGRLQEAGGRVWEDGSTRIVGRYDDPHKPEYNYLRPVDYCSGASLMIRAALFRELNGFDERFAPAYYEDTDLALRVRARGRKVMYQPFSQIFHMEGGTAGADISRGIKSYQAVNARKFRDKWASVLSRYGSPRSNQELSTSKWVSGRALVVDVWPRPDCDSDAVDTVHLLTMLLEFGYRVTFVPENTTAHCGRYTIDLQRMGVECLYSPYLTGLDAYLAVHGQHLNLVVLRRLSAASRHTKAVRQYCPRAKLVFDTVDLQFLHAHKQAETCRAEASCGEAKETRQRTLETVLEADAAVVISRAEEQLLRQEAPGAEIRRIPLFRDVSGRGAPYHLRHDILLLGNYTQPPGRDAVNYFIRDMWPCMSQRLADARLLFMGGNMPDSLRALGGDRVVPVGHGQDLKDVFGRARISIAPPRYRGGLEREIATSFSRGSPVVAAPSAVEAMGGEDGVHFLAADRPEDFANAVERLYRDRLLWHTMSENAYTLAEHLFSKRTAKKRLAGLLTDLGLPARANSRCVCHDAIHIRTEIHRGPDRLSGEAPKTSQNRVRAIAFYLPQFHPIPENDRWWGKGFTEWTNVTRAQPLFPGHYQPHLPSDLGFYDLRLPEARAAQAELAREYGLEGFCYYYYWFDGKRLLDRPLREVLTSGQPDFPFCLCWANENWTRRWDGRQTEILMQQRHSIINDRSFIREVIPAFEDKRYIRVDGKPLLMVYRTEILPDAKRTGDIWREECRRAGIGDIFLCRGETFHITDPEAIGYDAAYEFPPLLFTVRPVPPASVFTGPQSAEEAGFNGKLFRYDDLVQLAVRKPKASYHRFQGVMVSWDNTARSGLTGMVFLNSSPESYRRWLLHAAEQTVRSFPPSQQLLFINAWNEWAEGCHLEPDQRYRRRYLEMTRSALDHVDIGALRQAS